MQLCSRRLRQCLVGCIADQEVAKTVSVVAGELRPVRPDEVAPHQRGQPRRHLTLLGRQRLHRAAVEELSLDRSAFQHPSLRLVQLV